MKYSILKIFHRTNLTTVVGIPVIWPNSKTYIGLPPFFVLVGYSKKHGIAISLPSELLKGVDFVELQSNSLLLSSI